MNDSMKQGLRARWADSAWAPIAGKVGLGLAGFLLLAVVGSGRLGCVGKGRLEVIPEAAAATATATATAAVTATPTAAATAMPAMSAGAPPKEEEAKETPAGAAEGSGVTADGKVILNLASEEDLRRIPGVGPARAKAILALRARLGRFKRVEDLLRVKGIGRRSLARLRPLVVLDPA